MRLKYVEIQGFKSFPDKTRLSFERDITAVIGPNGSGKSNISDAIRWVLGEQSNKSLRGQKMEDVIFGGTSLRKPLGFAEVSITLDNTDRGIKFENDELTITRRYFRSGESEYKINNASVRLKDVNELFMDTGLGRDGYSMIGQGKIDEIVSSKSNERREIFEEAAGISRFRYRKADAQNKLEKAEDNLMRLLDIQNELESRVGPLEEQSRKAQEFLNISGEKRELEIGLWLNTLNKSKESLRDQNYKITLAKTQYEKIEREIAEIEKQSELGAQESQKIVLQLDAIRRESAKAEEEAASTRGEIAVFENTIFHNNETIDRITRDIEASDLDDLSIDSQIAEKQKNINEIEETAGIKTDTLNDLLLQLNTLADNSGEFSKLIEDKNQQLNILSAKISESRVEQVTAQTSKNEITSRLEVIDKNIEQLEINTKEISSEIELINSDMEHCDIQINECTNIVNGHEIKAKNRQDKLDAKKEELNKLQLDIGESKRRIGILQELERNMEGYSYAVKAVAKESQHGTLRGIHGPISRLINVPSEYATAIETALGAAAQNVVTSNEDDAKRAISFLKNTNGGRATFLPITSIHSYPLKENGIENCIGYIGMASGLVVCDEKYKEIIDSLLGRCVVSEDMDSAVATAKKYGYKFKVVTLDGQVVNAGGSLTGGSHAKNAGLLNRAGQIESLEKKVEQLNKKLEETEAQYKLMAEDLSKVNAELVSAKSEFATANEDKIRLLGEYKRLDEQLKSALSQLDEFQTQKKTSGSRIEIYSVAAADADLQIKNDEISKNEIEQQINELSGGRDKLSDKRNQLTEEVSALKLELIGYTKDVENLKFTIDQLNSAKLNRETKVTKLKAEIVEYKEKNANLQIEIEQLNQLNNGFMHSSQVSAAEIEALNLKRSAIEQESYKSRTLEREKSLDKEKLSGELARLNEREQVMEQEHDDIINKLYDEYELTKNQAEQIGIVIEDIPKATKRLNEIKQKIKSLGSVNVSAIEEYKEVSERYKFMKAQIDDVEKSRSELYKLIANLTESMKNMFITQFNLINNNFNSVFKELFGGGSAELRLSDPGEVLESGIEIIAQPPGKNISIIEQLSGGEKALIAVSIYFAIMKVNPPPFCLLDEVEAALDDVNVDKVATYLRKMSKDTQFIIITHRRGTMEEADVLYGVTMQEKGISKLLSIDVTQIEKTLESKPNK